MPVRSEFNEPLVSAVIILRALVIVVIVLLALGEFVIKAAPLRDMCLGGALGLMVGVFFVSFQVKSVEFKNGPQPSDVTRNPIV